MAKICQIAKVLYDVLKTVVPDSHVKPETLIYAKDVEEKSEQYEHYNILPLYAVGVKPAIMELPEIKAALRCLRTVDNLPLLRKPEDSNKAVNDILEWLSSIFGFQVVDKLVDVVICIHKAFAYAFEENDDDV